MRSLLLRHAFLLIGIFTLGLFFVVARTGAADSGLAVVMRILIIPMYLVWLVLTMAWVALFGPSGLPAPFHAIFSCLSFLAGLAPYLAADYLIHRRPRRHRTEIYPSDNKL